MVSIITRLNQNYNRLTNSPPPHSTSVLPFVTKILQNQTISKDYDDLSSYGGPMTTAYPWATAIPTAS